MDIQVVDEYGLTRAHHPILPQNEDRHDHYDEAQLVDLRKGPWTVEEDTLLYNYVSVHGEGRWNSLARHAGLKRTGKSCRLRWLNYLRPSVRRGNITLQEQLLILELHSRWGNRWSKIAQYLPGRTDNEIKNYWRTRVQKQAKQLKCDVNSKQFQDAMRHVWIPRLIERIHSNRPDPKPEPDHSPAVPPFESVSDTGRVATWSSGANWAANRSATPDSNSSDTSDGPPMSLVSELTDCGDPMCWAGAEVNGSGQPGSVLDANYNGQGFGLSSGGDSLENWWIEEDLSFLQQHLFD